MYVTQAFYKRQRKEELFDVFYSAVVDQAHSLDIGGPRLPRYKRLPSRLDSSQPHQFSAPKFYFRKIYYEACDLLIQELADRFEQADLINPLIAMESLLIKAANGNPYEKELKDVQFLRMTLTLID